MTNVTYEEWEQFDFICNKIGYSYMENGGGVIIDDLGYELSFKDIIFTQEFMDLYIDKFMVGKIPKEGETMLLLLYNNLDDPVEYLFKLLNS